MQRSNPVTVDTSAFRDRVALVTGGSDGIGLEIARALAAAGARVLLPVRNREKGERARARILSDAPGSRAQLHDLDLARLDTVTALVDELRATEERIDLLVLNAGIVQLGHRERTMTVDGFELAFQTNALGHMALTLQLLPLLRAGSARIAVQCSLAAAGAGVEWGDLRGDIAYAPFRAYRSSKAALGLFGLELARRSDAEGWGVSVQLCHPGIAPGSAIAPRVRELLPDGLVRWAVERLGNPPRIAALTALAALAADGAAADTAAASAAASDVRPRMFVPSGPLELAGPPRERAPFASLDRPGDARKLWDLAVGWCRCPKVG